jgi:mRNA-degrading endonuclease YafQ of YafQ-DinJ toxin-antitoxin module
MRLFELIETKHVSDTQPWVPSPPVEEPQVFVIQPKVVPSGKKVEFKLDHWPVLVTKKFRQGFNKHKNNDTVMNAFIALIEFIDHSNTIPAVPAYPPEYNVHPIKQQGYMWCHLQGQKIGLLFSLKDGKLKLADLGTHQEVNKMWR